MMIILVGEDDDDLWQPAVAQHFLHWLHVMLLFYFDARLSEMITHKCNHVQNKQLNCCALIPE